MTDHETSSGQLGFDALLADAETDNRPRKFERETAHLPDTMDEAIPFYRELYRVRHPALVHPLSRAAVSTR